MSMDRNSKTKQELWTENKQLWARLAEFEETMRAIRSGQVDAFFVNDSTGHPTLPPGEGESAYRVLVERMNEGAALVEEDGTLLFCNKCLAAMLHAPIETVMGASLFRFVTPADKDKVKTLLNQARIDACASDVSFLWEDGTTRPVQLSLSPMLIHGFPRIGMAATDLTERNKAQEELRSLSLVDELTGLLNRRGFLSVARHTLTLAPRLEGPLLLIFADLDGMKAINDTLGHREGDRALIDTARILTKTYRDADIIARLGGDEFTILAMGNSKKDTAVLAARLQDQVDAHNAAGDRPYQLSISVGIVPYDAKGRQPLDELIALADAAMYENKRRRHENFVRDSSTHPFAHDQARRTIQLPGL
jgi:diguanylate cyclase (GGDEF)-like protein/PAS domain S-box-containing protein